MGFNSGFKGLKNAADKSKIFQNFVEKTEFSLKSDKNNGYLHEDRYTFFLSHLTQFFLD